MDLSCRAWPWKTLIRSGHCTDRFDARKNENDLEGRDDEHLQARGHLTAAKLNGSNSKLECLGGFRHWMLLLLAVDVPGREAWGQGSNARVWRGQERRDNTGPGSITMKQMPEEWIGF